MFYKSLLINLIVFALNRFTRADYVATGNCTAPFTAINNGCYKVYNASSWTWSTANSSCRALNGHLLSLETLAETIAISYYLTGFSYTNNYWIDRIYTVDHGYVWSWTTYAYVNFGYFATNFIGLSYSYLMLNSSLGYDVAESDGTLSLGYICEEIVLCSASDNVCMNGGTCYVNAGRVLCLCPPGYSGELCEMPTDFCLSCPCLHGGTCITGIDSYNCSCTQFYTGTNCETEVPYQYATLQTIAMAVCLGFVGIIIGILCLMDIPWNKVKETFFPESSKEPEKETVAKAKAQRPITATGSQRHMSIEEKKLERAKQAKDLIIAEEEMLKRFKSALDNTKRSNRVAQSPVNVFDDPAARKSVLSISK